jgi:phage portal protein BeeE
MPPGILTKKGEAWDATSVEEQRKDMEGVWDRKYGNRKRAGKPIFTVGDLAWIPIGFSSFTDLQIEGINKIALRTLCNVWGIPSRVMNDMDGGAYTKDLEDRKAIYTNRLIPDNRMFWDGVNYLIQSTGIRYEPDYSKVPELQENKKDGVEMFRIGYECNAVQVNEMRERLQLEPDPEMEGLYKQDIGSDPELDEDVL